MLDFGLEWLNDRTLYGYVLFLQISQTFLAKDLRLNLASALW